MNALIDALGDVGYALDTPGAYLRGALAGKPGERFSGQDLLQNYGLSGENDPWGGLKGFGTEAILDPLSLAGPALGAFRGVRAATRGAQALAHADDANPLLRALGRFGGDEEGALRPFMEIGKRTDPDYVNSVPWWHGTATPGLNPDTLDPMKTDPGGLFGRGIYKTASPEIAGEYGEARLEQAGRDWYGKTYGQIEPSIRSDPARAKSLGSDLMNNLRGGGEELFPAEYGLPHFDGSVMDYLTHILAQDRPGSARNAVREILSRASTKPEILPSVSRTLESHGFSELPPAPGKTIYEANTNLGKILDLDQKSLPQDAFEVFRKLHGHPRSTDTGWGNISTTELPRDLSGAGLIERVLPWIDRAGPGDPLIQSLRSAGYDALSHTGGMRAGGGRNLHQVLISLDPNDTISRVGRAGQITRFEPQDIPELLRRFQAGG